MATGNGYFQHSQDVMNLAYRLVTEYDTHCAREDRQWDRDHKYKPVGVKKFSKPGGIIKIHE
jgi:hypothetical protein